MNFIQKTLTAVLAVGTIVATVPGAEAGSIRDNAEAQQAGNQARREVCETLYKNAPISLDGMDYGYQLKDGSIIRVDVFQTGPYGNTTLDCKATKIGMVDRAWSYTNKSPLFELGWQENTRADEWANNRWTLHLYSLNGQIRQIGNLNYGRSLYDSDARSGLSLLKTTFGFGA